MTKLLHSRDWSGGGGGGGEPCGTDEEHGRNQVACGID